jgi:hypothetical protein
MDQARVDPVSRAMACNRLHNAIRTVRMCFRHFIEEAQGQVGSVYGRRMYEVMRY